MAGLVVTVLSAAVKVLRIAEDGNPVLRPSGGFTTDGKPILKPATRIVNVKKDEPLPDNLADGELERLKAQGVVGESHAPGSAASVVDASKSGAGGGAGLDLGKLAEYAEAELAALWASKAPKVSDVLEAVGTDAALAAKALAAEKAATKGDGRKTLLEGLASVVDASKSGA